MISQQKLIVAGEYYHHYHYTKGIRYDFTPESRPRPKKKNPHSGPKNDSNMYRSRKRIKLLLQANTTSKQFTGPAEKRPLFVTFTFAENIQEPGQANPIFTAFIQRLNYQATGSKTSYFKYLTVIEFQDRGAIHYHTVFFNPIDHFQMYDIIKQQWTEGYTTLRAIDSQKHLINYLYKDLIKSKQKKELHNKKSFFCSKGLNEPETYRTDSKINALMPPKTAMQYRKIFEQPKDHQKITYTLYKFAP